jgi:hypothetical protein
MRRAVVILSVLGVLVLAGVGVAVADTLGAFKSSSPATTTAPLGLGEGTGTGTGGFGPGGRGTGGGGGGRFAGGIFQTFGAASTYLGVSTSTLFSDLQSGKTLASVAKAEGKSVSGLIDAMVASEKQSLASAVSSGQVTQAQEQQVVSRLQSRIAGIVNSGFKGFGGGGRFGGGGGFGNRGGGPGTSTTAGFA